MDFFPSPVSTYMYFQRVSAFTYFPRGSAPQVFPPTSVRGPPAYAGPMTGRASAVAVRPAEPTDLLAVAEIYAYYVARTMATFEEGPPSPGAWYRCHVTGSGCRCHWRGSWVRLRDLVAPEAGRVRVHPGWPADCRRLQHGRWTDTILMQRAMTPAARSAAASVPGGRATPRQRAVSYAAVPDWWA
jgi:hypothetical protein